MEPAGPNYRHRGMNLGVRLFAAWLLVAMVACGERTLLTQPGGPADPRESPKSYDGTWRLVEGRGPAGDVSIVGDYRITLNIEGEIIGGTAACNAYHGEATIQGASFEMRGGSMTEMACRPDVMESESTYMTALQAADTISRRGDILSLVGDDTKLRFEIVPPIPTAELTDTTWKLESLIYGTGDDGTATAAEPADLLLKSDGTISGTTGCRELYGEWREDGDEIAFTTFGAEGKCTEELREQDSHVVGVLGDGFVPTIKGDRLTVVGRGGLGLEYRALGGEY